MGEIKKRTQQRVESIGVEATMKKINGLDAIKTSRLILNGCYQRKNKSETHDGVTDSLFPFCSNSIVKFSSY